VEQQLTTRLLIKQVIGRLLLDTSKKPNPHQFAAIDNNCQITIHEIDPAFVSQLKDMLDDLNFFYFEEEPGNPVPLRKWWLYAKDSPPRLAYNENDRILKITVDSRVSYSNDKV